MNSKELQAETEAQHSKNADLLPSAPLVANPMLAAVYVAIWKADGEEPYVLNSNECKPKEHCSDSDWWFDINTKMFRRYWSLHDEVNGNQYVHNEVKGVKLNGS